MLSKLINIQIQFSEGQFVLKRLLGNLSIYLEFNLLLDDKKGETNCEKWSKDFAKRCRLEERTSGETVKESVQ